MPSDEDGDEFLVLEYVDGRSLEDLIRGESVGPRQAAELILAVALALTSCSRGTEPTLRIGTNVWIGSEPLYLARELGHLDPKIVQLVEYPSASEVLRAFRNQAIDGMAISLDELFGLAVDGLKPRVILVLDESSGADVVVGRPGMRAMSFSVSPQRSRVRR